MVVIQPATELALLIAEDVALLQLLVDASVIVGSNVVVERSSRVLAGAPSGLAPGRVFDVSIEGGEANTFRSLVDTLASRVVSPWIVRAYQSYLSIERGPIDASAWTTERRWALRDAPPLRY